MLIDRNILGIFSHVGVSARLVVLVMLFFFESSLFSVAMATEVPQIGAGWASWLRLFTMSWPEPNKTRPSGAAARPGGGRLRKWALWSECGLVWMTCWFHLLFAAFCAAVSSF